MQIELADESATLALGARLARAAAAGGVVFLVGELGAGKTTLVRGLLRAHGHQGSVRSPTYTLVEPYELQNISIYHFDLYRLADAQELAFLGVREYFRPGSLCLVEWPERGAGVLPAPDLQLTLEYAGEGRRARLMARSARGEAMLAALRDG